MTKYTTHKNAAVSPIIGVMLLLIVTVMIAAIVSSYASSLSETHGKTPQLIITPEIYKDATDDLYMNIPVLSVGSGLHTRDLRIITEWRSSGKSGGGNMAGGRATDKYPTGHGAGVPTGTGATDFGNYTLLGGTLMYVNTTDGRTALFGPDWASLGEGDLVKLKIIHIPSQATIVDQDIIVRET
jgi:FlaG/FlaF family flagellin (archaellin)